MHRTLSHLILAAFVAGFISTHASTETALDRYVAKPDPNYSFKLLNKVPAENATVYILEMTSQQYLTTNEVDKPIWKHYMTVIKPDVITSTTGLLFIGGGGNDRPAPNSDSRRPLQAAHHPPAGLARKEAKLTAARVRDGLEVSK